MFKPIITDIKKEMFVPELKNNLNPVPVQCFAPSKTPSLQMSSENMNLEVSGRGQKGQQSLNYSHSCFDIKLTQH